MSYRLYHVTSASFTLRADERRALRDPTERLAKVARTAHKRHFECMLVDVVLFVRRRQNLRLVDVVDADRLKNLYQTRPLEGAHLGSVKAEKLT